MNSSLHSLHWTTVILPVVYIFFDELNLKSNMHGVNIDPINEWFVDHDQYVRTSLAGVQVRWLRIVYIVYIILHFILFRLYFVYAAAYKHDASSYA